MADQENLQFELQSTTNQNDNDNLSSVTSSLNSAKSSYKSESPNVLTRSYNRWSPLEEGVTIAWKDLSVDVLLKDSKQKYCKRIINSVTGAVKAGSLVALMGATGAGKSTLMSALAYRQSGNMLLKGDVLVNGRPIGDYMYTLSGFMHQDDLFVGSLTVYEHMNIMARLKLDRSLSSYDRKSKIYDILSQLGLIQKINTRIGVNGDMKVLSGGEKKRLAFATELLTDPPILFCDEPTTGLDSYSAQKLISIMNLMAARGKTIICTIHQPSSELFAIFSQILLLADGRVSFMGETKNALEFFKRLGYRCPTNYNPADFFIRTLAVAPGFEESSKQTIKRICDHFAVSEPAKEINVVVQFEFHMGRSSQYSNSAFPNQSKSPFWWTRLSCLFHRSTIQCLRDPTIQGLRILQKIAIAITVGLCYLGTNATTQSGIQSVQGAIFIMVAENTFTPMYSVLDLFPQEQPLFLREYKSGLYSVWIYYTAKCFAILPGIILEPTIFAIILYLMSGLRQNVYAFFMTVIIAVLTMNISSACGFLFSIIFESVPTAMAYLIPFDVVLMITQGIFIKLSSLPIFISWAQYISWLMYSTESLLILQWDGIHNITCEIADPNVPCISEGLQVLEKYSFATSNYYRDFYALIFMYFAFHIISFVILLFKTKRK